MKKALGYITMDAGDGVPGSILKHCLKTYSKYFDYTIVVDGNLTSSAKEFYKTIPNLRVVDSPWTGRHLDQYWARTSQVENGDWLLAFDDDEYPSENLLRLISNLDKVPPELNIIYSPSLTYIDVDDSRKFWRVQEFPDEKDCSFRSKRLLYRQEDSIYFIHSPCGMHVTPTHVVNGQIAERRAIIPECYFYHLKTLESFIYNECVYIVANPDHESGPQARQLTQEQENKLVSLVQKYNLGDIKNFKALTQNQKWPEEFKEFVYQFKDNLGQSMCKFYYLYEYIVPGYSEKDVSILMDCVSLGFTPVYNAVRTSNELPIEIERTDLIWKQLQKQN